MTDEEVKEIRKHYYDAAEKQANAFIKAIKEIDKTLPADVTDELRNNYIMQAAKDAIEFVNTNVKQIAEHMEANARRMANERQS